MRISKYNISPTPERLEKVKLARNHLKTLIELIENSRYPTLKNVKKEIVEQRGDPRYFENLYEQLDRLIKDHPSTSSTPAEGTVGGKKSVFDFIKQLAVKRPRKSKTGKSKRRTSRKTRKYKK